MRLEELVEAFIKGGTEANYRSRGYSLTLLTASGYDLCGITYKSDGQQTNIFMREGGNCFVWDCVMEGTPHFIDDKMRALQEKIISLLGMRRTILPTMTKGSGDWHILAKDMQPTVRPVSTVTIDNLWGEL